MKIPVFVSSPTKLNIAQEQVRGQVFSMLDEYGLEPRALGQSDYPTRLPLREVVTIAKHCAGGLVLGFEQQFASEIEIRRGLAHLLVALRPKTSATRVLGTISKGASYFLWAYRFSCLEKKGFQEGYSTMESLTYSSTRCLL